MNKAQIGWVGMDFHREHGCRWALSAQDRCETLDPTAGGIPEEISSSSLSKGIALIVCRLNAPQEFVRALLSSLSSDERERVDRIRVWNARNSFIIGRGLLRIILSCFTGTRPAAIRFTYGKCGKPATSGNEGIRFNVAHSNMIVLIGLSEGREIGVDIEHVRGIPDGEELARRFFCPSEYRELLTVERSHRIKAFFDCWTRKEAFVKALGDGLSYPLDRFQVTLRPEDPPRFVNIDGIPGSSTEWSLRDISPREDYAAAVAIEKLDHSMRVLKFDDASACADFFSAGARTLHGARTLQGVEFRRIDAHRPLA
jgi:4'-phosphopantetheinyl transferase